MTRSTPDPGWQRPFGLSGGDRQLELFDTGVMAARSSADHADTAARRKARGAFFTPAELAGFVADWAIRGPGDRVLEPSSGDAAFLVPAVARLRSLADAPAGRPVVHGVEIHPSSARAGERRVRAAGGVPRISINDFFLVQPEPTFDCVIGNPPFIRFQDFAGTARDRAREAAARSGVPLSRLASSWAAFTVHAAAFLTVGGRLGLVLPAELLSVNYAGPIRRHLLEHFRTVDLVLFDERVFPEAETDVVLVLADGYGQGPTDRLAVHRAVSAAGLSGLGRGKTWKPAEPAGKWTAALVPPDVERSLRGTIRDGRFVGLESWGDTTLGIVTGNNRYFTLSPGQAAELGIPERELLPLSPPGSSHLRGLRLDAELLAHLGQVGKATRLFRPDAEPSRAARAYLAAGQDAGVDRAYKCRIRKVWHQVPLVPPADLLLTCMNADTPRLTTNLAGAYHLNSVHGVYLRDGLTELGRDLLPLASLNAVTLLHAEVAGRSYGGGILKLEPKEADVWAVPSPALIRQCAEGLRPLTDKVSDLLDEGRLPEAVEMVDQVLLVEPGVLRPAQLDRFRQARADLARRRAVSSIPAAPDRPDCPAGPVAGRPAARSAGRSGGGR